MKLSVIMMAYNQGQFIDEAIAPVLAQHLPFEWELLIGDDMSQDKTGEIASAWAKKHPRNITYYRHASNIGLHRNYELSGCAQQNELFYLLQISQKRL